MLTWLSENMVNIVIIAVLVLVVGFVIRGMIRDKKAGKSSCGGSCASCGACAGCAAACKVRNSRLIRTRIEVEGMMCGMCEAHINDAVRKVCPVKKVSSSHTRGETVIITDGMPDVQRIRKAIEESGYSTGAVLSTPYVEKKNLRPVIGQ